LTKKAAGIANEVRLEIVRTLEWMKEQTKVLSDGELNYLVDEILNFGKEKEIFVTGKGRSGLVARAFAMRLAHLGYRVRILGEDTAPPVKKGDLFLVVSGGGENRKEETKIAKNLGATIVVVTSYPESTLGRLADICLVIRGREKEGAAVPYRDRRMRGLPVLALGTSFEDYCLIVFDSIIGYVAADQGQSESDLQDRHTPLQL